MVDKAQVIVTVRIQSSILLTSLTDWNVLTVPLCNFRIQSGIRCNDHCHPLHTVTLFSFSYSLHHYTPFIFILIKPLHPFHCHGLHTIYNSFISLLHPAINIYYSKLSLPHHLVVAYPGHHRQPTSFPMFSWHVQITTANQ